MKILSDSEFTKFTSEGTKVIDFFAEWCGPCRMLGPIFEEASKEIEGAELAKVNVDESPNAASEYGVRSIPTLVIVKDGKEVARNSGAMSKEQLINWIKENS